MHTTSTPRRADERVSLRERKKRHTWNAIHEAARALATSRGFAQSSVEEICADANVSTRTFFNYFPTKAAAVLGLPATGVHPEHRARFLADRRPLLDALCDLVADSVRTPGDVDDLRRAVAENPELGAALHTWVGSLRADILLLASQRSPGSARNAVALVFAALALCADEGGVRDPADLREALAGLVATARTATMG